MIPVIHDQAPEEFLQYKATSGVLNVTDFDSVTFQPVKLLVKKRLFQIQKGFCVYCERKFEVLSQVQVDHLKPKSGKNAHPELCFEYKNYVISCIQNEGKKTISCGQKKGAGLIPIEPISLDCNNLFKLDESGRISAIPNLSKTERHNVTVTLDMLGLNKPHLLILRKKRILNLIEIMRLDVKFALKFIDSGDFSHILQCLNK